MTRFLLDANLSPETAEFLAQEFGFDMDSLQARAAGTIPDEDVVALAKQEERVVITFDQDFGEIFYLRERGKFGVIVLRLENQTIESVNSVLRSFFDKEAGAIDLATSLVVVEEDRIRVVEA